MPICQLNYSHYSHYSYWHISLINYSCLIASMGFTFTALRAGR